MTDEDTTLDALWSHAETEACTVLDGVTPTEAFLERYERLGEAALAPARAYWLLWKGVFAADPDALRRSRSVCIEIADGARSDVLDRGWWLHNAVVAEVWTANELDGGLLSSAISALRTAVEDPQLDGDRTARWTFELLRVECSLLAAHGGHDQMLIRTLAEQLGGHKPSLAVEFDAVRHLLGGDSAAARDAFIEASRMHELSMHKLRCRALAATEFARSYGEAGS